MKLHHLLLGLFLIPLSAFGNEPGFLKRDGEIKAGFFLPDNDFKPCGSEVVLKVKATDKTIRAAHNCGGGGLPIYKKTVLVRVVNANSVRIEEDASGQKIQGAPPTPVRLEGLKELLGDPGTTLRIPGWLLAPADS